MIYDADLALSSSFSLFAPSKKFEKKRKKKFLGSKKAQRTVTRIGTTSRREAWHQNKTTGAITFQPMFWGDAHTHTHRKRPAAHPVISITAAIRLAPLPTPAIPPSSGHGVKFPASQPEINRQLRYSSTIIFYDSMTMAQRFRHFFFLAV